MSTRTTLLVTALAAAVSAAATAQSPAAPPAAPQTAAATPKPATQATARLERLLQGITLTPATRARIDSIYTRHVAMVPATPPGSRPDSAALAQMRTHLGAADAEARALLTTEQQRVWDRNLAAASEAMPSSP